MSYQKTVFPEPAMISEFRKQLAVATDKKVRDTRMPWIDNTEPVEFPFQSSKIVPLVNHVAVPLR